MYWRPWSPLTTVPLTSGGEAGGWTLGAGPTTVVAAGQLAALPVLAPLFCEAWLAKTQTKRPTTTTAASPPRSCCGGGVQTPGEPHAPGASTPSGRPLALWPLQCSPASERW